MSVPKIRSTPSPRHVSDRLRRAKNFSNEQNPFLENSTENNDEAFESVTRNHMTKKSINDVNEDLHKLRGPKNLYVEKSIELPESVINLVRTQCKKGEGRRSSIPYNHENDLSMEVYFMEVLRELKQDAKKLDGVHAHVPCGDNIILNIINDCFRKTDDSSEYSSLLENAEELIECAKMLTGECIEIIERIIYQQSKNVINMIESSNMSARKKKKTLLLNTMLGIEHEMINSEKILEIVNRKRYSQSFQFMYCLLKYFMTKIASRLQVCGGSDLKAGSRVNSRDGRFIVSNFCVHADSEQIPNQMIEDCSNRHDKLLQQWTPTGDSCHEVGSSQYIVNDRYRDAMMEKKSQFTGEIKRKLFYCRRSDGGTQSRDNNDPKDDVRVQEESKTDETSEGTACGTEVSAFYSWYLTGHNRSHRAGSGNRYQCSHFDRPRPGVHGSQNNCQTCSNNGRGNYHCLTPVLARGRSLPITNVTNYYSTYQPMAQSRDRRCMSPVVTDGIRKRKLPPTPNGNTYRHPPVNKCTNNFTTTHPLADSKNTRCITSPVALQPFPKLQLPNFSTTCNARGTRGFSHSLRCIHSTDQINKLSTPGNRFFDGNCGKCLVIRENNPKPSYYHKFPGFKGAGFYDSKYADNFHPHLFDAFSVSPEYVNENPTNAKIKETMDRNSLVSDKAKGSEKERKRKGSEKERKGEPEKKRGSLSLQDERISATAEEEREKSASQKGGKSTSSEKERKNLTSKGKRTSLSKGRKSLSPYINDNVQQMDEQEISPSISKERQENTFKALSLDKSGSPPERGSHGKERKESGANKIGTTTMEYQSGEITSARTQSRANVDKVSRFKSIDSNKPSLDALRRNDSAKAEENDGKERLPESKSSKTDKSKSDAGGQQDDYCTCCRCKTNNENDAAVPMFFSPCQCNGMNNQDPRRLIFQFFASPLPFACNCSNKSITNKPPLHVQKTDSRHPDSLPSSASRKKRDSQDAETQTGKKPSNTSDPNIPEPFYSESSSGQIAPVQSSNDATCTDIYSRSSSYHRGDAKSDSKHSEKCLCPQNIEGIFQEFDDKYSKCVQEIKLLIREGYIPRFEGSDESFTLTHEVRITPSRSKSGCRDYPSTSSPKQQLRFQKSQDKSKSDDSYVPVGSRVIHPHRSELREDIEELKRLVKNSTIACPCCKCCKCEKEPKVAEECSDGNDSNFGRDPKKQSDKAKPGMVRSESSLNRGKPPKIYTSTEIEESNKEPQNGADVFQLSLSFVEPELPPSVQELITPPESNATKSSISKEDNKPLSSKGGPKKQERNGVNFHPKKGSKDDFTQSEVILDNVPVNKSENFGLPLQEGVSPAQDNDFEVTTISLVSSVSNETKGSSEIIAEPSSKEFGYNQSKNSRKNTDEPQTPLFDTENEYTGVKRDTKKKKEELRWQDGLEIEDEPEDIFNGFEVQLEQSVENESGTHGQKTLKERTIDTEQGNVVDDGKSATEKKRHMKTLEYDDETEKLLEQSVEREALNQSREHLFDQLKGNVAPPKNYEVKKSWNPFSSIFGVSGGKTVEEETSKSGRNMDDGTSKSRELEYGSPMGEEKIDDVKSESGDNFDDGTPNRREKLDDSTSRRNGKTDDELCEGSRKYDETSEGRVDEEYLKRRDDSIDDGPKLVHPCEEDDDFSCSSTSSCAAIKPCWSSSFSTIDECKELFDSIPCDFYSEESITEVIKATETELYVMIVESQSPVGPPTAHHHKLAPLLLSGNNVDVMGYSHTDSTGSRNISRNCVTPRSAKSKSYAKRKYQTVQPQYPVEIISLQRSYDSSSEIESSGEDQTLSITKKKSLRNQMIQQKMKERKSSNHSKREENVIPKPTLDIPLDKKNQRGPNKRKNSGDVALPMVESGITNEEVKSKTDKEVQVTKWNAKVQTAGPRKFNRTDIPKDVEDKLAPYLGLERTAEQMDLKLRPMEERTPTQRDPGRGTLQQMSKRESKKKSIKK